MKYPKFLAAILALCFFATAAWAADASPAGTWKWTSQGRGGNPGVERTVLLEFKDGKLTGTLKGVTMGQFEIPDTAIGDGSFKDGVVSFTVTTEFNGNKMVAKYQGKLAGDAIAGSYERPGRDGNVMKTDWNPKRTAAK